MKTVCSLLFFLFCFASCKRDVDVSVPVNDWDLFQSPNARPLPAWTQPKIEGVYTIEEGSDLLGNAAALKWSYTVVGNDTTWHLSAFCSADAAYLILQGKQLNGEILLNGYWRKNVNDETGKVRLTITGSNGATSLLDTGAARPANLRMAGVYGLGDGQPGSPLSLRFNRNLRSNAGFEILAHRGGGRNADLLPASENSVEMLRLASRFGATGVEIDVRRTSDGELVLFHDATLNERLIVKNGMVGPIENYTYAQLNALVQLKRGGKIPTLRQALQTILVETPLRFVWIDTKYKGSLDKLRQIQQEFLQMAAARGRNLQIVIGVPDEEVYNNFLRLSNYQNVPSLCELDIPKTQTMNARVWAPTWTLGLQTAEVAAMQAEGRRVFVWTLDGPERIQQYLNEGSFNGILSNQPMAVAHFYYAKQ
jgi:glycerophosphoryl diester phosphodiesterase